MKPCPRTTPAPTDAMSVQLAFQLPVDLHSDILVGSLLIALFRELTDAGLDADHITLTIEHYRPAHHT